MLKDTSLQRNGKQTMSAYGLLDNLVYVYDGNQIKKITNDMLQAFLYSGYRYVDKANTDTEFSYDANGNMTRFADKRITSVSYNLLNLPEEISMPDDNHVSYQYDTEGNKLHVRYKTSEYQMAYPGFPLAQEAGNELACYQESASGIIADISTGQNTQPRLYNGKELDMMHGLRWHDHGARLA